MNVLVPAIVLVAALQASGMADDRPRQHEQRRGCEAGGGEDAGGMGGVVAPARRRPAAAPKIDFTKRTVVAVFLGSRSSAGYAVEVTGTKPAGKTLIVEWSEQTPKPGNVSAQVITSPSHLVSIPKFEGEITFRKVER